MISIKATIKRLATGVPGLDEILGGGLPEFSFNLIAGPPGSGKTTLAHQMMFALASDELPALYFTVLGEPPLKILRYQQQFDHFDLDKLNRCVRFISLAEEASTGDPERLLARIASEVEMREPGLVVVDSFNTVMLNARGDQDPLINRQNFIQSLGALMVSWQATTLLLGEFFEACEPNPIFTVADGLIWLSQHVERNSVVRKLEIMKMRGQLTLPGLHSFRLGQTGIEVFPPPQLTPGATGKFTANLKDRLGMGNPELDAMMGGGLPRGYSLLVAGPSGSGKSVLAAAFLSEGARLGETGVIAAFEQRSMHYYCPQIAELIGLGRIGLIEARAANLSVDEIATQLLAAVKRLQATRVVIDSLSGFELTLAPTFRADFRESLARMLWALAGNGVTVLMTSELEDRYTELRFSPYGSAFMTDAIIVQRYIEVASRLQRVLAVVKVRSSPHSNALRLFEINDAGIQLGAMLPDQEGLLGGQPRQRHAPPHSPIPANPGQIESLVHSGQTSGPVDSGQAAVPANPGQIESLVNSGKPD